MVAALAENSWWSNTTWFEGGVAEITASPAVVAHDSSTLHSHNSAQPADSSMAAVGGAKAQSRFNGKTAIPMGTCAPLSSSATLPPLQWPQKPASASPVASTAPITTTTTHGAWVRQVVGHTIDGSVPASATGAEHVSKWQWQHESWVHKGQQAQLLPAATSEKHQLAARRRGDSRDALAAAACGGAGLAPAVAVAAAAAASPAKRPRLRPALLSGEPSDGGFAAVGGLARQKEALMSAVAYPLAHPRLFAALGANPARGVLLHGPPGSGKTHLVRALAAQARMPIVVLNGGEAVGEDGEKKLRRAFSAAKSEQPCILFLDEVDAMAPCRQHSYSEHERAATARLLAAVDELRSSRCRVALVAATSRRQAVDSGLRRAGRLDSEVALGALDQQERLEVLRCLTRNVPLDGGVDLAAIAPLLQGYVAADVAAVCAEAALACAVEAVRGAEEAGRLACVDQPEILDGLCVTSAHFEGAVKHLGPSMLRGLTPEVPDTRFEDVGGLQEVKQALRELVELPLTHGHLLKAYGLPPPRGALLYGPPGCGKTMLARAAASCCGANFLSVRGPELLQKWLGESEAAVRSLFETARAAAPCLIFFDELDSIAGRRGSGGGGPAGEAAAARVLNQLLLELDGIADRGGVFLLAATNRPEALDPAILRPGRLDSLLQVPLPDSAGRQSILASCLARCPLGDDMDLAELAGEATLGMSGADLAEVCRRAGTAAIRELIADEQRWEAEQKGMQARGGGVCPSSPSPQAPPLSQRQLMDALTGMRRSVSAGEAERHARIEQRLKEGSLTEEEAVDCGEDEKGEEEEEGSVRQREQQAVLRSVVQQAVSGSVERQMRALQERVQQLEAALKGAGLEVPQHVAA